LVPGGRSGLAGLLPTPPQSSNLLSQLSSPEAQLALASNLLSTLLRPQQPSPEVSISLYMEVKDALNIREHNVNLSAVGHISANNSMLLFQVPSLLSLGSLGHMGSPDGSGYRQHSGYGPGRYQDPGPNRRKRMDSRRQEPYSKVRSLKVLIF
jgi:hypothetical protein